MSVRCAVGESELDAIAHRIQTEGFSKIALQFPDSLLHLSAGVVDSLAARTAGRTPAVRFFILADTTFGSCCVDEVAAQHVDADFLVHFGNACLSPTKRLPVHYAFGCDAVDAAAVVDALSSLHAPELEAEGGDGVIVLYEPRFAHAMGDVAARLRERFPRATIAALCVPPAATSGSCGQTTNPVAVAVPGSCGQTTNPVAVAVPGSCGQTTNPVAVAVPGSCGQTTNPVAVAIPGSCGQTTSPVAVAVPGSCGQTTNPVAVAVPATPTTVSPPAVSATSAEAENSSAGAENSQSDSDRTPAYVQLGAFRFETPAQGPSQLKFVFVGDSASDSAEAATGARLLYTMMLAYPLAPFFSVAACGGAPASRETLDVSRTLKRRYVLLQKARAAGTIGIVVGTLGVADYLQTVRHLQHTIRSAGKRALVFLVGRPRPEKLANFPEVDVFVLVACPLSSLVDSAQAQYFKPVVTPLELERALVRGAEWQPDKYELDFRAILPGGTAHVEPAAATKRHEGDDDDDDDDDEVDVSLVTGRLCVVRRGRIGDTVPGSTGMALVASGAGTLACTGGAARSFWGLETHSERHDAPAVCTEGRTGIAAGYQCEAAFTPHISSSSSSTSTSTPPPTSTSASTSTASASSTVFTST